MKTCQLAPVALSFILYFMTTTSASKDKIANDKLKKLLRDLREELSWKRSATDKRSACSQEYVKIGQESGATQTMCKPKNPAATNAGVSAADKQKIVDFHNKIRSEVKPPAANMQKLKWDDELAKMAQHYAETCPKWHDQNNERIHPKYGKGVWTGQNIAQGQPDWNFVLNGWYNETKYYKYGKGNSNNMMAQGKAIGHYTQQIWAKTTLIGCGYADCPGVMPYEQYTDKNMFACEYIWGQSFDVSEPYKKGSKMGEDCPDKRDSNGLCDCDGLVCAQWGVEPDVSTCTCGEQNSVSKKSLLELLLNEVLEN